MRNNRNRKKTKMAVVSRITREGVGARIQRLREDKGWKQSDLAKRAGFDQGFISHVESGKKTMSLEGLVRIAAALDLTPATLLDIPEFQRLERAIVTRRTESNLDAHFYEKVGRLVYGRFLATVK